MSIQVNAAILQEGHAFAPQSFFHDVRTFKMHSTGEGAEAIYHPVTGCTHSARAM